MTTYKIRLSKNTGKFNVFNVDNGTTALKDASLDEAGRFCWVNRDPHARYQVLYYSPCGNHELAWHFQEEDIFEPMAFATVDEARLEILETIKDCEELNGEDVYLSEFVYVIVDTFTGKDINYSLHESYKHQYDLLNSIE